MIRAAQPAHAVDAAARPQDRRLVPTCRPTPVAAERRNRGYFKIWHQPDRLPDLSKASGGRLNFLGGRPDHRSLAEYSDALWNGPVTTSGCGFPNRVRRA